MGDGTTTDRPVPGRVPGPHRRDGPWPR
ncbi:hypothetical protein ACLESD_47490, partial [Pyxidicoccus sp. 3LFB2]